MSRASTLTTTSYAILSLLAVKSWSTYELTQQMERSMKRMWPRAASKLYEEPKKLVEHGYARAKEESVGRRPRTVYAITPKGRRALARWLKKPGAGPVLEFEGLLKVTFAENGTTDDVLRTLDAIAAWAKERNVENLEAGRAYTAGSGPFQHRVAINSLGGRFFTDFYVMVAEWEQWARAQVEQWPDDPSDAVVNQAEMEETVRRATW
jgi:DNA-binding PadR family transcriptional regulator